MANFGQEVGSSAIGTGFVDRDQKATVVGSLVLSTADGHVDRTARAAGSSLLTLSLADGQVDRTAFDAWSKAGTIKTIPLPSTRLIRPVYGIPLFGAGTIPGTFVGENTTTNYGPSTGQQWPRGAKTS